MYTSVLQPEMEGGIGGIFLLQKCEKSWASPWGGSSYIALDLISTHDYMSEMQLGRSSGQTFWGRENVGT